MRVILAVEVLFLFACAYVSVCVLGGGVSLCVYIISHVAAAAAAFYIERVILDRTV